MMVMKYGEYIKILLLNFEIENIYNIERYNQIV